MAKKNGKVSKGTCKQVVEHVKKVKNFKEPLDPKKLVDSLDR